MYELRKNEIAKMKHLFRNSFYSYALPLYEYHYKLGRIDRVHTLKFYHWDDASKIGAYYDYVQRRIRKYGLHWGLTPKKFDNYKEQMKKEEDELVDYFIYEMRKPPSDDKEIISMKI
jgi:hypothetical protein